mmetsp:Transcript_9997/g.11689  ORF Transcript_9997/g.11689 Transcript_9997/m.11689 type:complete len:166 (+) Transcript_9997:84-581(+)|eukprot:CAMPEP_0198249176 /NCGR_PEP_ID=MMETSP1447-20131203/765_1 /TAXON_ID=420782 /ORGANISM="Chaetoceros dichaeta, Strain CCMP1751" /LENGTH=165 /DNA_ID=CAMNT_0043933739 /DNA_START=56 /DNA_END=553 /DNA_ORIENTATION=+
MAKGLRSKVKRRNRTEFRNTIGQDAAKKNMEIIQSKLQACIQKGSMNSIGRLSNLLNGNSSSDDHDDVCTTDTTQMNAAMDTCTDDVSTTPTSSRKGKDPAKIPHKASTTVNKRKKKRLVVDEAPGQTGAKLARQKISKMNKRGQMKKGQKVIKRTTPNVRKIRR